MRSLTQSPFLEALGYAIVNSLWQFALIWFIYMLLNSIFNLSSHRRYATALMLQLTGFTWFIGTLIYYYGYCLQFMQGSGLTAVESPATMIPVFSSLGSLNEKIYTAMLQAERLLPYLSLAYILLLIFLTIKMSNGFYKSVQLRYTGLVKSKAELRLFVQRISLQLGIKRHVRLHLSNMIQSPVTIGFLKPLILLPVAAVNHLSIEQLEAILLHELAHIKRHDYLINLFVALIDIALFFNPFTQLLSRHIKRERENSCDDWVLQYEYNAATYAKALLKIATTKVNATPQFAMAASDNKRVLLNRVKRMIEKKDRTFYYRQQLVALLLMTGVFVTVAWFAPPKSKGSLTVSKTKNTKQVEKAPLLIASNTNNILFNPVYFLAQPVKNRVNKDSLANIHENARDESVTDHLDAEEVPDDILKEPTELLKKAEAATASFTQPEKLFAKLDIDTELIRKEFRKIQGVAFTAQELNAMQLQLNKFNAEVYTPSTAIAGYNEKLRDHALSLIDEVNKLRLQYTANKKDKYKANGRKNDASTPDDNQVENEEHYKKQLEVLTGKVKDLEALRQLHLSTKPRAYSSYTIEIPAVLYSPTLKRPQPYSYEYKVMPKSPTLLFAAPQLTTEVRNRNEFRVKVNENEPGKEVAPPDASGEKGNSTSKRFSVVHI